MGATGMGFGVWSFRRLASVTLVVAVAGPLVGCSGGSHNPPVAAKTTVLPTHAPTVPATVGGTQPVETTDTSHAVATKPERPQEWPAVDASTKSAVDGYLAGAGLGAEATVSVLSGLTQPDPTTCQQVLDQLDAHGGPSGYLDVAVATPDPVLAELLTDLAAVASDALAACVHGGDTTATFAALHATLDYISLRRSDLEQAG